MFNERYSGFSLVEVMIVFALISALATLGANKLNELSNPLSNAVEQLEGILKQARAKSMTTTSSSLIYPDTSTTTPTFVIWRIPDCSQASLDKVPGGFGSDTRWTEDKTLRNLELPKEVNLTQTNWKVCINSRGLAMLVNSFSGVIELNYSAKGQKAEVQIYAGGGVASRWLE